MARRGAVCSWQSRCDLSGHCWRQPGSAHASQTAAPSNSSRRAPACGEEGLEAQTWSHGLFMLFPSLLLRVYAPVWRERNTSPLLVTPPSPSPDPFSSEEDVTPTSRYPPLILLFTYNTDMPDLFHLILRYQFASVFPQMICLSFFMESRTPLSVNSLFSLSLQSLMEV